MGGGHHRGRRRHRPPRLKSFFGTGRLCLGRFRLVLWLGVLLSLSSTSEGAKSWPALERALESYPAAHEKELDKLGRGGRRAKVVLVRPYHGLGNRGHALVSAFALALFQRAAFLVDWHSNAAALSDLFEEPGFTWTAASLLSNFSQDRKDLKLKIGGRVRQAAGRVTHGTEGLLLGADLLHAAPWNTSVVVSTDHQFLRAVLCNRQVVASGLFPPDDAVFVQARLERFLLRPVRAVRSRVRKALKAVNDRGGCAVGLHLRTAASAPPPWDADAFWRRLEATGLLRRQADDADLVKEGAENEDLVKGALFIAADAPSQPFKKALLRKAAADGVQVVRVKATAPSGPGSRDTKEGVVDALTENYVLSSCRYLVPTQTSTFFNVAAVRAASKHVALRDIFVCYSNATSLKSHHPYEDRPAAISPLTGEPMPCLFDRTCPTDLDRGFPQGGPYFRHGQVF